MTRWTLAVLLVVACEREAPNPEAPEKPTASASAAESAPPPVEPPIESAPPPIESAPPPTAPAPTATASQGSQTQGTECKKDSECACGKSRATGKCAFGPASQIDPKQQCPDFCSGIAGHLRIACQQGKCVQVGR